MISIHSYDPALDCSAGVRGITFDRALVSISADALWARQNGVKVKRWNRAQQPMAFADNDEVKAFLERSGRDALPLGLVDGEIALPGRYPTRAERARWSSTAPAGQPELQPGCCTDSRCC